MDVSIDWMDVERRVSYLEGFVAVSGLGFGAFFGAHGLVAGMVSGGNNAGWVG